MLFQTHKKGFIADVLTFMVSFLAILLVVLIFLFLLRLKAKTVKPTFASAEGINELNLNPLLLNYLRSTTTLDGKEITIADLIVMYKLDKDKYEQKIKQEIPRFINSLNEMYEIEFAFVIDDPYYQYNTGGHEFEKYNEEKVLIPTPEGKIGVKLILYTEL